MTDREKLVDILSEKIHPREGVDPAEVVADYLLDNGVVPVVHGEWLKNVLFYGTHTCSNCGKDPNHFECVTGYVEILSDYCPNCGAKMDGGRRSDER